MSDEEATITVIPTNDELCRLLLEQPRLIMDLELTIIELTTQHETDVVKLNEIETTVRSETAMNLSLKNEEQRKAAREITLRDNATYQELRKKVVNDARGISEQKIGLSYQRDMLRSYLSIAGMR